LKVLITGIRGFLASALATRLLQQGHQVRGLARQALPALKNIELIVGILEDKQAVYRAVQDCDLVFHVAAKAGVWGCYQDYYLSNVIGTRHIIQACLHHQVPRLIYTSSPSVVFAGQDEEGIQENVPYPKKHLCHYATTKAIAEQDILAANSHKLATISLRPHLIWGEGDRHLIPRLIERGQAGKIRLIGKEKHVDCTYIDNAVLAHTQAALHLHAQASCAGKAYFISNNEPMPMCHIINQMLACANIPAVRQTLPTPIAYTIACIMELAYTLLRKKEEPLLTRFVVRQLSCAHWYNLDAAKKDLGYIPTVSIQEGMKRLKEHLQSVST